MTLNSKQTFAVILYLFIQFLFKSLQSLSMSSDNDFNSEVAVTQLKENS